MGNYVSQPERSEYGTLFGFAYASSHRDESGWASSLGKSVVLHFASFV